MQVISKISKKSLYIIYSLLSVAILNLILINSVYAENVDYNVTVQPTLNVTTSSNNVSLRLNPATNPFDSQNLTVSVGTNNQTGYKLIVSTPNDITNLVEQNDSNLYIETLASVVSESSFTPNRWGYKLNSSSTNYTPFESGILVNSSDGPTEELVSTTMTFGAKADYDTKAGTYNLALNFQATANPLTPIMQNLDVSLCTTAEPTLVIDSRDEQEYYVQRLADGNCWMLQNLKLGKSTTIKSLTTADSNVPNGGFILDGKVSDGVFPTEPNDKYDHSVYYCTDNYGCYYNWYAATASSGTSGITVSGQSVDYSICPAGWILPTQSEWAALIAAYNNTAINLLVNPVSLTENTNGASAPGLLLGGAYWSSGASTVGAAGDYSSRTAGSDRYAYGLYLDTSTVRSNHAFGKSHGTAMRCIRSN